MDEEHKHMGTYHIKIIEEDKEGERQGVFGYTGHIFKMMAKVQLI